MKIPDRAVPAATHPQRGRIGVYLGGWLIADIPAPPTSAQDVPLNLSIRPSSAVFERLLTDPVSEPAQLVM